MNDGRTQASDNGHSHAGKNFSAIGDGFQSMPRCCVQRRSQRRQTVKQSKGDVMSKVLIHRILFVALATIFMVLPAAAQSSARAAAKSVSVTGTVSCSKFAGLAVQQKAFTVAETIHMCISQGYSYTLVAGKEVYPLQGDKKQLWAMAGETVTVTGNLNPDRPKGAAYAMMDTIETTTIVPAKD
jgi:hypothetical protein